MFCEHCGASIQPGLKFCSNCGKPVSAAGPPTQPAGPPGAPPGAPPRAPYVPPTQRYQPQLGGGGYGSSVYTYVAAGLAAICAIMIFVSTFLPWITQKESDPYSGMSVSLGMSGWYIMAPPKGLDIPSYFDDFDFDEYDYDDFNLDDLEDFDWEDFDYEDLNLEDLDYDDFDWDEYPYKLNLGDDTFEGALASAGPVTGAQQIDDFDDVLTGFPGNFVMRVGDGLFFFTGFWALILGVVMVIGALLLFLKQKSAGMAVCIIAGSIGFILGIVNIVMAYTSWNIFSAAGITVRIPKEMEGLVSFGAGAGLYILVIFSAIAVVAGILAYKGE